MASDVMPLVVVGCDFRTASSSWRSKLVLNDREAIEIAEALKRNEAADGFVDLSTCNRNEWIVASQNPNWAASILSSLMIDRLGPEARGWFAPYVFSGEAAARHLFMVALGQESLVVGERQIASQIFQAFERARKRNTSARNLNGISAIVGRLVRSAVREQCVGSNSVGAHSLAVAFLSSRIKSNDLASPARIAVVGLGQIGRRVLGILEQNNSFDPVCVNRTISNLNGISEKSRVHSLSELPSVLRSVEAAIICTSASQPIVDSKNAPARPQDRPLLLIDLGIPEQVERRTLPENVIVAGLDELTAFHCESAGQRSSYADDQKIVQLVNSAVIEMRIYCSQPAYAEILNAVQQRHDKTVEHELPKVLAEHLVSLPEPERTKLAQNIHELIIDYTNDIFKTIRNVSEHGGD